MAEDGDNVYFMSINYPPNRGDILVCNFSRGFVPPEMVKKRLVIVVNKRLPKRSRLCSVVPLSTTAPHKDITYQIKVDLGSCPGKPYEGQIKWAKADMVTTVSYDRLDLIFSGKCKKTGKRRYHPLRLSKEEMTRVQQAIIYALQLN